MGTVKTVVGQAWTRYEVKWDSGEWMSTVSTDEIVREDRLALYHARQAAEAERAAQAAATKAAAPSEAAATSEGGDSRVPEHLLARSRAARARVEAARQAS